MLNKWTSKPNIIPEKNIKPEKKSTHIIFPEKTYNNIKCVKIGTYYLPPTQRYRDGSTRHDYDEKTFLKLDDENLFNGKSVLIGSDWHSHTRTIAYDLSKKLDLSKVIVILAGDMSGERYFGSDGDPTDVYEFLYPKVAALYFIQGNHDLKPRNINRLYALKNKDNSPCYMTNGFIYDSEIGKLGCVHGTISNKPHVYKMPENNYYRLIYKLTDADITITHETPSFLVDESDMQVDHQINPLTGKDKLYDYICRTKSSVHIYGHCHHPQPIYHKNNKIWINADSRILLFNYPDQLNIQNENGKLIPTRLMEHNEKF